MDVHPNKNGMNIGIDPYPIEQLPNISADHSLYPPALIRGQRIARSRIFEAIVFVVLSSNAIWTGRQGWDDGMMSQLTMEDHGAFLSHRGTPKSSSYYTLVN